jgi:hypothetical protein
MHSSSKESSHFYSSKSPALGLTFRRSFPPTASRIPDLDSCGLGSVRFFFPRASRGFGCALQCNAVAEIAKTDWTAVVDQDGKSELASHVWIRMAFVELGGRMNPSWTVNVAWKYR